MRKQILKLFFRATFFIGCNAATLTLQQQKPYFCLIQIVAISFSKIYISTPQTYKLELFLHNTIN